MSLKAVHILFVTVSSLLSFLFGGWCMNFGPESGTRGYTTLGVASVAFGVGLVVYGFWFWRKIAAFDEDHRRKRRLLHRVRMLPLLLGIWTLGGRAAHACSVCYGDADGPMIDGARIGTYAMFGLVLLVQSGFAAFFITLWRRSNRAESDASGSGPDAE